LREDVILAQVAERLGEDVLGESHLEAGSAVVQALRDRGLMIVCAPDGCSVTDTAVDTTGMTTQSVQETPVVAAASPLTSGDELVGVYCVRRGT
jgi:hypothetical protein